MSVVKNIDKKITELNKQIREQREVYDEAHKQIDELKHKYHKMGKDEFGRWSSEYDDPSYNGLYQAQLNAFIEMEELKKTKAMLRGLKK